MNTSSEINVLKLTLHDSVVGYLSGFRHGKNVLSFANTYRANEQRPTFSLITHPQFPRSAHLMAEQWSSMQRLHPVLSNLLPEGALRELIAQGLNTHIDHEFHLLSYLGSDLPGALIAEPIAPADVPDSVFATLGIPQAATWPQINLLNKFSLAGVQMKFSMKEKDGRYNLRNDGMLGDWIIKTPSTRHQDVPLNEYSAMKLAALTGINIPEIQLIELNKLENLPPINLPNEHWAYAIKRFDRIGQQRVHMEDFAQILVKYPHEKYSTANYEQIGKVIYQYSGDGLTDVQQFARRLLVNILLANGDAHLKNWSLYYPNQITPRLAPAYDIVTTAAYIAAEQHYALNLAKTRAWYEASYTHFEYWANRVGAPWRAIKPHLDDVQQKARDLWPQTLIELPMNESHKHKLRNHWKSLHPDFRV